MPNWDEIRKEFELSKITLAALAEKHAVKLGTLKSRKSREGWGRDAPKKVATKKEKVATVENEDAPQKSKEDEEKEVVFESDELTDKQRLFCIYYVKSFNATQSAIKANYAPDSAHVEGSRLLRNAKVAKEIKRIKGKMTDELFLDAMDVLKVYVKIAFADITDYAVFGKKEVPVIGMMGPIEDEDGNPVMQEVNYVDFKESTAVDGSIITEVKQGKDGISVKLADKMKALDKLAQYFDLFPDNFKRQVEEEKLKIAHHKAFGSDEDEEYEDDGFEDALNVTTSEVWADVKDTAEEES
ncbi:terminase small subunit [Peribacillus asahii]|uniref:terminase small subunit n=1 Tax=Peribacillus asahii TaxID=228899 RepID=UPI002079CE7C|nr:terminase small subunit [Peribacillus asahii]USK61327.1 terminase small subunit [Peribacillus asahii]